MATLNPSDPASNADADVQSPPSGPPSSLELKILGAPDSGPRDLATRVIGVIIVFILSWLWAPWLRERPHYDLALIRPAQDLPPNFRPTFERALNGDTGAMRLLGSAYYHGLKVPRDTDEGLRWYRRAAAAGDAEAARELEQLGQAPEDLGTGTGGSRGW